MNMRFKKKGIDVDSMGSDFHNLIFRLLCYDPGKRMTIEQLKEDPWINDPAFSNSRTRKQLAKNYLQVIQRKQEKLDLEKQQKIIS